ncbi:MAG: N-acetylmuramoyl-L-alanine amidase [Gammaproteobacteria bacterium]
MLQRPLRYADRLVARDAGRIDLAVIHCTELPDLEMAREYGERIHYAATGTGNAGHFYVDRDGTTEQWVPLARVAHHVRGWNERSVGIELVNRGRYPDWLHSQRQQMTEPYTEAQLDALLALLRTLRERLPGLRFIAGHEVLDRDTVPASDDPERLVRRKRDPGPLFPWERVLAASGLEPLNPGGDGPDGCV